MTGERGGGVAVGADGARPSLRERKKTKTRAAIQEHALRLFREQGYDRTSVEQIADAAEVSPSTFFRYFRTKEDVALYDPLDPVLIEAFLEQPPELSPMAALRAAWRTAVERPDTDWLEWQRERADLLMSVPELRRRMLDEFVSTIEPFATAIAQRVDRPPDDPAVRNLLGAILGVALVAWLDGYPTGDYLERIDAAFAHLEAGLPIRASEGPWRAAGGRARRPSACDPESGDHRRLEVRRLMPASVTSPLASTGRETSLDSASRRCHHPTLSPRPVPITRPWRVLERPPGPVRRPRKEVPIVIEHISLVVNGERRELDVEPRRLLVQVLREDMDLTGTHVGCDTTQCGACTVVMDGQAVKSCTVLGVQADGCEITTIEGLAPVGGLHPLQDAFRDEHGLQCGFCTPGMIMASTDLLARDPRPSDETIRHAIEGNMCRCTGYQNIVAAVRTAAERMSAGADLAGAGASPASTAG